MMNSDFKSLVKNLALHDHQQKERQAIYDLLMINEINDTSDEWVEVYTDASFNDAQKKVGLGGLFVNAQGLVECMFQEGETLTDGIASASTQGEFIAVKKALELAKQREDKIIFIRMDSKSAAETLMGKRDSKNQYIQKELDSIYELEKEFKLVKYLWIPRHKNEVADELSKRAANILMLDDRKVYGGIKKVHKKPDEESTPFFEQLEKRHPGLSNIITSQIINRYMRGDHAGEFHSSKADYFLKIHTVHGFGEESVISGVEGMSENKYSNEKIASTLYSKTTNQLSPALTELKLLIRCLKRLKKRGVRTINIETSNHKLAAICSGMKEAPEHIRSAVYTFFQKASEFEKIQIRHRMEAPVWAEFLEFAPLKHQLKEGFQHFKKGFPDPTVATINSVILDGQVYVQEKFSAYAQGKIHNKTIRDFGAAEELRLINKAVHRLKRLGISNINLKVSNSLLIDLMEDLAETPVWLKSDWGQFKSYIDNINVKVNLLNKVERTLFKEEIANFKTNSPKRAVVKKLVV